MKKDHVLEQGFTLIEIIIVLVLLGILAATAVPKYFDLQKVAQARAAQSAIAELQAQVNMTFANELMKGSSCTDSLKAATTLATDAKTASPVEGWTFDIANAATGKTVAITSVTRTAGAVITDTTGFQAIGMNAPAITLPTCE